MKEKALSSEDRLRKQLLGKNARVHEKGSRPSQKYDESSKTGKKHYRRGSNPREADSDEEAGRASTFKSKRTNDVQTKRKASQSAMANEEHEQNAQDINTATENHPEMFDPDSPGPESTKSRATNSYLDEILEKKERKRKKRKKNREQKVPTPQNG